MDDGPKGWRANSPQELRAQLQLEKDQSYQGRLADFKPKIIIIEQRGPALNNLLALVENEPERFARCEPIIACYDPTGMSAHGKQMSPCFSDLKQITTYVADKGIDGVITALGNPPFGLALTSMLKQRNGHAPFAGPVAVQAPEEMVALLQQARREKRQKEREAEGWAPTLTENIPQWDDATALGAVGMIFPQEKMLDKGKDSALEAVVRNAEMTRTQTHGRVNS